ncbi:hypothetical protein [Streptomyces avicenniae]|uniref:hypothetical protein n=1 Tax=Streptomyces avicenniae TaxID=500153 RepID=UPI00069C6975|nr:hypothetical protein [Streptomyces avicenniae]
MTDHDSPDEGADLGARLRQLARDVEPAVLLPGADAARRRGERRRARRRAGTAAGSFVLAAALAAGTWQFGPWRPGAGEPVPPAAEDVHVPSPPPPAGLPWDDRFGWRQTAPGEEDPEVVTGWRDKCAWPIGRPQASGETRFYEGRDGAVALWETYVYESSLDAEEAAEKVLDEGRCAYGARTTGDQEYGPGIADTGAEPGEPGSARVYTLLDGNRLGVLRIMVGTPEQAATPKEFSYPYVPSPDDGSADCLSEMMGDWATTGSCGHVP